MKLTEDIGGSEVVRHLNSTDEAHIIAGLTLLRAQKMAAYITVRDAYEAVAAGLRPFTESDFGIPQIDNLIEFIQGE